VTETDFEAEGLLDGLQGPAREARMTLLRDLVAQGVSIEEMKLAASEGRLLLLPVERVFEPDGERYTIREIAERSGLERGFVEKLLRALGLPTPDLDERTSTTADLEATLRAKQFLDAGLPEEGLLEVTRIIGMGMAQLASANRDLIGEVFIQSGIDERELAMRYAAAARSMTPLLGETLRYAHDLHLR
jgi:adenylate cyclase